MELMKGHEQRYDKTFEAKTVLCYSLEVFRSNLYHTLLLLLLLAFGKLLVDGYSNNLFCLGCCQVRCTIDTEYYDECTCVQTE